MKRQPIAVFVVALVMLSMLQFSFAGATSSTKSLQINEETSYENTLLKTKIQKFLESDENEFRLIVAPKDGYEERIYKELQKIGKIDPISKPQYKFIVVTLNKENLKRLLDIEGIDRIWKDRVVKLEEPIKEDNTISETPQMFLSVDTVNAYNAWMNYSVYGDNVTVAVLDTGIDGGHPFLQVTLDGRPKIIDIYDASDEGLVEIYHSTNTTADGYIPVNKNVTVFWGYYVRYYNHVSYTNYTMGTYYVGNITGDDYYIGLLPERYFDLNDFTSHDLSDVYPVLIVNQSGNFVAYIDLNLDNNFTNDQPIGIFELTRDYVTVDTTKVHIAFEGFYGDYAYFMWDSHGHGTHVSGTIAGVGLPDDPIFSGVYGIAPNAQLMEVRVLTGEIGIGAMSWIINGMIYAAAYGPDGIENSGDEADVINMSLGSWTDYNDGTDNPEAYYINYLTEVTGTVFAVSAGNNGPALNTGGSPGNADLAITVGAYVEGSRWGMFYGVPAQDGLMHFSSRGPRMDGMLDPDVIAPGGLIFSSVPLWYTVAENDPYYYFDFFSGTSMAAPHVAGAAALLISYAKENGLNYDPIKIKQALMLSAEKIEGLSLMEQGFGLIQIDKAIETLSKMSNENTVKLYVGTPYTSFKTPYGTPWIPANPLNDRMVVDYNKPYLYRGIYLRNEWPTTVPVVVYSLNYNGTVKVYSDSNWVKPVVSELQVNTEEATTFYVEIDYSKISALGLYEAIIYIDNPETTYLEGFIPITVIIPEKPESGKLTITDSYNTRSMKVNRYFFEVPEGAQIIKITVNTTSGNEATFQLVPPYGTHTLKWLGYTGYGLRNRTITLTDPTPGTWELVVYAYPTWTPKSTLNSTFEIEIFGVTAEPKVIRVDADNGEEKEITVTLKNLYAPINATVFATDNVERIVGVLPGGYYYYKEFSPEEIAEILYLEAGIKPLEEKSEIYIEMGYSLTNPYPVYRVALGGTVSALLPDGPAYVYAEADKDALFYMTVIKRGNSTAFTPLTTNLENFGTGESKEVTIKLSSSANGTVMGALGIEDESGNIIGVVPIIFQVGQPEMYVGLMGTPTIGEPTTMTLKILDKATLEPIQGEVKVFIDGKEYYAVDGELKFIYTATSLNDAIFNVKVISDKYKDFEGQFRVSVKEPFTEFASESNISAAVLTGPGEITNFQAVHGKVSVTVSGETGTTSTVRITLPLDAYFIEVQSDHVVNYYIEKGKYAQYLFVTVKFASEVTIEVTYKTSYDIMRTMYMTWYLLYNSYSRKFDDLYAKAIELGVDNETLQEALTYKELAEENYNAIAEKFGIPIQPKIQAIPYIRRAYINIKTAYEILSEAIEDLETS